MQRDQFIRMMETIAPPSLAEDFDIERIGLVLEGKEEIGCICTALDATPTVVERAVSAGADVLVLHHTPLWEPVHRLKGRRAGILRPLFMAGINVYVMHTNFDHAEGGVNAALASLLGLTDVESMSLGLAGTCTLSFDEMMQAIGGGVRIWGRLPEEPEKLAVVGGSGFDPLLMDEAVSLGADAFLSSELKHSVAIAAPLPLIESTHYALEAPGMQMLAERHGWEFIDDPPEVSLFQ